MIERLVEIEKSIPGMVRDKSLWNTLLVDYHPPVVERCWTQLDENTRLFLHVIHATDSPCLLHKHRWPAAFKVIYGAYEVGFAEYTNELTSADAHRILPQISRHIVSAGSYYEMLYTHTFHYVKPIGEYSVSLMLTGPLYEEASYRRETDHPELSSLSDARRDEILSMVADIYGIDDERN